MYTECRWSATPRNDDLAIAFEGDIDFSNAALLLADICATLKDEVYKSLILDLSAVGFIDRVGLGLLVKLGRSHAESDPRVVVALQSQPARIIRFVRFGQYFPNIEYVPRGDTQQTAEFGELCVR